MKIDWFTFAAQIVNFIILVLLLKRFLYGRITEAMDARERHIAGRFHEAQERERVAEEQKEQYARKTRILDTQKADLLARAHADADAARRELIEAARRETRTEKEEWQASLRDEEDAFFSSLRERTVREVFAVTRRVLADLSGAGLEERIIAVFLSRLQEIDEKSRKILSSASSLTVHSTFPLSDTSRRAVAGRVREILGNHVALSFETAADLICGIELKTTGRKLSWTVDRYLGDMETNIRHMIAGSSDERQVREKIHAGTGS